MSFIGTEFNIKDNTVYHNWKEFFNADAKTFWLRDYYPVNWEFSDKDFIYFNPYDLSKKVKITDSNKMPNNVLASYVSDNNESYYFPRSWNWQKIKINSSLVNK